MRTFDRATFLAARAAWSEGDFGDEWRPYRQAMVERGWLWPPAGTRHDERDTDEPSQRAIVHASIVDTPRALMGIIGRSRSWSDVVAQLIAHQAGLAEAAGLADEDAHWERRDEPTGEQATEALHMILGLVKP